MKKKKEKKKENRGENEIFFGWRTNRKKGRWWGGGVITWTHHLFSFQTREKVREIMDHKHKNYPCYLIISNYDKSKIVFFFF